MDQKRIKLVALDLDGTTLDNNHKFTVKTIETLQRLNNAGVIIVLATGRSTLDIVKHFRQLELAQKVCPGVGYNGAHGFVCSFDGEEHINSSVFECPLNKEQCIDLVKFAKEKGHVLQYYNSDIGEVYAAPVHDTHHDLLGRYASLVGKKQLIIPSYDHALSESLAAKILIMTHDAEALHKEARERFPNNEFNIILGSPDPFFVEFLRPDASKGAGLVHVCKHLGVDMSEVVAFGDGDNDKEMLQLAGMGVAMKNAKPAAMAAADIVLEWSNDEEGVARHLEHLEREGYFTA